MNEMLLCLHVDSGGETKMLPSNKQAEILTRNNDGQSIKRISREMDLSRNTVRQTIRNGGNRTYSKRKNRPKQMEAYGEWAKRRFFEVEGNATLLYQELRTLGYAGGYTAVKEFTRPLRERLEQRASVRFETPPGQQAQVDWGSKTVLIGDRLARVHIFVMTMGYSRASYAELTTDEKIETLARCHEHAFEWFGGVPEEILYDNPKTIVLERNGDNARINPKFEDFSRYYGYTARLCKPYRAQTKGKVESGIKYVKRSFLPGKTFQNLTDGNNALKRWIREVADERIHGTTFEKPSERMKSEGLTPLGARPAYVIKQPILRKVAQDGMINLATNRYSVPWTYIGQWLEIRRQDETICLYKDDQVVALHVISELKHGIVMEPEHYQGLRPVGGKRTGYPKDTGKNEYRSRISQHDVQIRSLETYAQLAEYAPAGAYSDQNARRIPPVLVGGEYVG